MKNKYDSFKFDAGNHYLILRKISKFSRTESGKSWKAQPFEVEQVIVDDTMYTNYITAIPFFDSFGEGAYCRARYAYFCAGYLPATVATVSPYKTEKHVAQFDFINKSDLLENAGFRERDIIEHTETWEAHYEPSRRSMIYRFTTPEGKSAEYEAASKKWVG